MAQTAVSIGANVFQFFLRNPRGGAAKPVDPADIAAFLKYAEEKEIGPVLAHASYTLNAASADSRTREFAEEIMRDDLQRLQSLPGAYYNFHPGSHVGQGAEKGIVLISGLLTKLLTEFGTDLKTTILLETMAGKGSEIGRSFEEIREIIDQTEQNLGHKTNLGVCLDTCHIWDGGYDIVGKTDEVMSEFDRVIGLARLKAIHLNDSLNVLGAHKDRHAGIAKGKMGGESAFATIINHPLLRDLPFYLETPCDLQGYKEEIAYLKGLRK